MSSHQVRATFMQSPLVAWVRTFLEEDCSDYTELCNGTLLQKVWLQIDPQPTHSQSVSSAGELASLSRIRNLSVLLNNIRSFYESVLDQVLVIKLPDVINIALSCNDDLLSISQDSPFYGLISSYCANTSNDDIRTILLLILGCAVQCDQKEVFIEKIKQLDIATQHAIVENIQQIHQNPESVFIVSEWGECPPSDKEGFYSIFVSHISRLTKERDQLYQRVVDLSCELLNLTLSNSNFSSANSASLKNLSLSNSSLNNNANHCDQKSHYLVELAEVKSKLRRLQQELEEKNEVVVELKEVIEQNKEFCNKLRHDNLELTQEARSAKAYRDEIDVLNERVRKIDRLETEVQRYKDKVSELDFYKSRVDEMREDNRILCETKAMLEEQLDASRKRAEKLPELEEKILKLNAYGNEINLQRELDKNQIERLIEEITHLRQEKKFANDELAKVQLELSDLRTQMRLNSESSLVKNGSEEGNLFEQINQDASKRIIKLEHENQKLQNLIEDYRNNYVDIDSLISLTDMSSETSSIDSGFTSNKSKVEKLNELKEYIEKLKVGQSSLKGLENAKLELDKEVIELKGQLHDQCNKFEAMERNYTQASAENQKFQRIIETKSKRIDEYMSELSSLENENQKLVSNSESLKLSLRKLNDLEIEMTNMEGDKHRLEQEKKSLDKEINRLKTSIEFKDKIIDDNANKMSTLELENKKLKKEVDNGTLLAARVKEVEKENKDLSNTVTVQKNTLTSLQQSLVLEKLQAQKYADELEKVLETINKLCLEQGLGEMNIGTLKEALASEENFASAVGAYFRSAMEKCLIPKEAHIEQLQSQIEHLSCVNKEMQTMIDSLRRQLNTDEDSVDKFSMNSLNELQRKIVCLEDESKSLKSELTSQKEACSEMSIKSELADSKLNLVNERNLELQNESARLQVENSLLKSQNESLESQTSDLQAQMAFIQDSIDAFKLKCEEYECTHKLLIADNESLQEIHQQLTADYDNLTHNHSALKQSYKTLKSENKSLEDELKSLMQKHELLVTKTNEQLQCLREKAEKEHSEDSTLKEKLNSLAEEHKNINEEYKRLQNEHKMLQNIYKKLRSDNNELKLKHTELQGETAECKDRMNALNVEVSKLSNYCEMVALTNNTLETQRKKLTTQSASLLSQYNDLLLDLSNGCEKTVGDKLRELCLKKERLEKMFKEYDISIEKNMPRVSNKNHLNKLTETQLLDDAIYGRIWEAETPPLNLGNSHLINSTALLRQYSLTNHTSEKDKHADSPPRIPPRHHIPRHPMNIPHLNSHETVIELTQIPNSVLENKMSINVSTRSPNISISKTQEAGLESNISKLQITSSANSPLIPKASFNPVNSPVSVSNNSGCFMRGSFKSSSVNYGNYMRRSMEPNQSCKVNGSRHGHHSPQLFHASPSRNLPTNILNNNAHRSFQYNATSPSLHSDSSASHSPHESEKESDIYISNINNNLNSSLANGNSSSVTSRVRNLPSNGSITAETANKSPNGPTRDTVLLSNALNNNSSDLTQTAAAGNCTNAVANDNATNSNSIWYEYGCV